MAVAFEIVASEAVGTEREPLRRLTIDDDVTEAGCRAPFGLVQPDRGPAKTAPMTRDDRSGDGVMW
jgi:hypothetical protein